MAVERKHADEFRRRIAERNATPTTERTTSPLELEQDHRPLPRFAEDVFCWGWRVQEAADPHHALMLGEWLTNNLPANGAMPTKRWAELWKALYDSGDVERG